MVRKTGFALLLGLVLALPPAVVHALALGDLRVRSALNEPLDAEIPILASRPDEIDGLVVGIADPEAFRTAGLERPFLLSRLRFQVTRDARGLPVVRIRSREPIREPVLSFIVEAVWPKGRLLREYTILLDPPVTTAEAPPPVAAPARAAAAAPAREAPAAVRETPAAAGRAVPRRYGPVRRSETLWAIANRLRPGDVTVEQMMVALRDANPEAFVAGDINRLKAGYVLRVPAPEEVRAIDPAAARAEVRRQIAAWRAARRQARAAAAPARLRLVAPEGEKGGEEAGKTAEAVPGTAAAGEGAGAPAEAAGGAAEDPAALKARIAELQGRLEQMEQLLALKDDELATLQEQLRRLRGEAGAAAPQAPAGEGEAAGGGEPAPGAGGEEAAAPPAGGEEAAEQAAVEETPAEAAGESAPPAAEEEQPTQVAAAPSGANPYARPDFPRVDLKRIQAQPPAVPERAAGGGGGGVLDALAANPYSLWAGGAVAVLLAALLLLAIRRRRLAAEDFQESILTQQPQAAAAGAGGAAAAEEPTPARVAEAGESALMSDFASSDLSALETEAEADPIAEADVYLAYGRYRQAESLIREAIEQEPERSDLKVKLLEILHAAGDRAGFESAVAEHQEALMADEAVWARVLSMGRALAPDNPLFAEEGLPEAEPGEAPAEGGPAEVKLADIDLGELEEAPQAGEVPEPEETLDFDLGAEPEAPAAGAPAAPPEEAETPAEAEEARLEDTGTIEWEVPEIESEPGAGEAPAAAAPAELPEAAEEAAPEASETPAEEAPAEAEAPEGAAEEAAPERIEEGGAAEADEAATKLDLARAYMEMGDPDGARELLQEVMAEGNEAQRAEAEGLLKQLG